jgi:ABC-type phosphonate transport system ATPase subunit
MSDLNTTEWEKELRVLLHQIQAHPSREAGDVRQRIAVLKNLIATRAKVAA